MLTVFPSVVSISQLQLRLCG